MCQLKTKLIHCIIRFYIDLAGIEDRDNCICKKQEFLSFRDQWFSLLVFGGIQVESTNTELMMNDKATKRHQSPVK